MRTVRQISRGRYWTQAEDQRLLRLYHDGLALGEIGRRMGRPLSSIDKRLTRLGVGRDRSRQKKPRAATSTPGKTLCWDCAHAAGPRMCCWALDFIPVPGWDAIPTGLRSAKEAGPQVQSYLVRACPQFEEG